MANRVRAKKKNKRKSKELIDLAKVMDAKAHLSPIWQGVVAVQDSGKAYIVISYKLEDAELQVAITEAAAAKARSVRDELKLDTGKALDLYVANAENSSKSGSDLQGLCLEEAIRETHKLQPPLGLHAEYNRADGTVDLWVDPAPGITTYRFEHSGDPYGPTTFEQILGHGATRKVPSLPYGTHWFRVRSVVSDDESAFIGPVAVIVK